jgi:23S rRNA (cytidine1920-2'-O)/16S rRNA (cytidine1409-2'-O)-methyltransferase
MAIKKQHLDAVLVERGLAENKGKAQALIMAGEVRVNNAVMTKPGNLIPDDAVIDIKERLPYVSRGGLKLAHALDEFKLDVSNLTAIDAGASTGGFTDCLLQRGALKVYAVDVGYNQLDYKLRKDSRVVVMEKTNLHFPFTLPEKADIAVIDVSFISVTRVIPNIVVNLKDNREIIVLLKPQFEARKEEVGIGGIIKDPDIHARVIGRFVKWLVEQNIRLTGLTMSPITGAEGNREFLLRLQVDNESCKE